MGEFVNHMERISDIIMAAGVLLPIVWALLIVLEWIYFSEYYHANHIEHSYRPDYKIAFNPRYITSALFSLVLVIIAQGLYPCWIVYLLTLVGVIVLLLLEALLQHRKALKMKELGDSKEPCVTTFRKAFKQWRIHNSGMKIAGVILFSFWFRYAVDIIESLLKSGSKKLLPYIGWFMIVCIVVHIVLNNLNSPYHSKYDYVEYLRIVEHNGQYYSIVAPIGADSNDVCVAVRTVVCKKGNDLIFGFLILDDSITMEAPYTGDSFLVAVDFLSKVWSDRYMSALCTDDDLRKTIIHTDATIVSYFERKEWRPIDDFGKDTCATQKEACLS